MNRAELVQRLWEANRHLTRRDAEVIVAVIFDEIATSLVRGERVELRRLGAFSIRKHAARIGRNPKTGEAVAVGEKHHIHFKTSRPLHDRLQTQINAEAQRKQDLSPERAPLPKTGRTRGTRRR